MHILYIHQHFAIPAGSTGTRSYEFSRRWVKAGNKVTVITGNYDVGGLGLGKALVQRLTIEGVEIIAVGAGYSNKLSFLGRVFAFLCFMIFSVYVGLRVKGVDVIYATSTPLTVGIPAILLKWLKRVPFVFEVRDQWPEIPIEMGILKNKALIKILLWLERTIYHQSAAIVALSPGMADGVRRVLKKQRPVAVVPNSSDTDKFRPDIDGGGLRRQRGWMEKCVFLHAGAMGKANGLDFVIDAAERLRDNDTIHFVLIGEGGEKNKLKARIESVGLANIEIIDSVPKEQLPGYFAACDVSIVLFADYPILEHNSANKFFDSLSAGKPVLLNYSGWQRDVLESSKAGFGCERCNPDEFTEKLLQLASDEELRSQMGRNARLTAEQKFARDKLAEKVSNILATACQNCTGE